MRDRDVGKEREKKGDFIRIYFLVVCLQNEDGIFLKRVISFLVLQENGQVGEMKITTVLFRIFV